MKFLCTGDWHIRKNNPVNRTDVYYDGLFSKLRFIYDLALDTIDCWGILQPGDFFDRHDLPYGVVERTIRHHSDTERITPVKLAACFGQHDQRFHTSDKTNTPLGVFMAGTTSSFILEKEPLEIPRFEESPIHIYGSSWGEDIPEIQDSSAFNILVTHRMVTKNGPLWSEQEHYEEADILLKKLDFNLIVCGDNHNGFVHRYRSRYLINCGSLMRSTLDQMDHRPFVVLFDTETKKPETVYIPVIPIHEVMNMEKVEKEKEKNEQMDLFISKLKMSNDRSLDFKSNLQNFLDENKISPSVKQIISEVMS